MDASGKRPLMEVMYESVHRNVDRLIIAANYVLAILMICFGIIEPYSYLDSGIDLEWNIILGFIILVTFGVAIILFCRRDLMRSAGMYALALGLYRFVNAVPNIHRGEIVSAMYIVLALIALNLIVSGFSYIRGITRGRRLMIVSTSLLIAFNASFILYGIHSGMSIFDFIQYMPGTIIMIVLYAVFLGILNCEQLRSKDLLEIHNRTLDEIRCTWCTMPDAYVQRDVAYVMSRMFTDRSGWSPVSDGGPAECEYRFEIRNRKSSSYVLMQKWEGDESIFLTVSDHLDGTLIHAYRFEVTSVTVDGDDVGSGEWLRLDSDSGTCMNLIILDREEPR